MKLPKFQYLAPRTIKEASTLLKLHGATALPIAGGSDLLVAMKNRLKVPEFLVDLKAIPGIDRISFAPTRGLSIGAMAALQDLIENPMVREKYPLLVEAAQAVGTPQVQAIGTLGGNLCLDNRCYYYNQSPLWHQGRDPCHKLGGKTCYVVKGSDSCWATYCADLAPALLALQARVKIADPVRGKTIPLQDLYSGDGKNPNTLKPGQLIAEILLPPPAPNSGGAYIKLRRRRAIDFPLLGIAVNLQMDSGGNTCREAHIALTSVEKAPILLPEASYLKGKGLSNGTLAEVTEAAYNRAHPLDNLLGLPPSYRKAMVKVYLERALRQGLQAAQQKGK